MDKAEFDKLAIDQNLDHAKVALAFEFLRIFDEISCSLDRIAEAQEGRLKASQESPNFKSILDNMMPAFDAITEKIKKQDTDVNIIFRTDEVKSDPKPKETAGLFDDFMEDLDDKDKKIADAPDPPPETGIKGDPPAGIDDPGQDD